MWLIIVFGLQILTFCFLDYLNGNEAVSWLFLLLLFLLVYEHLLCKHL